MRPRIRSVKPEMRKDERYGRLSLGARELFNGLITTADDEGRFRALSSSICGDIFPYDTDAPKRLRGWVKEVQESGMVLFYVADGVPYGAFRHWAKHQKINRPTPSELPPPPDSTVATENAVGDSLNAHGVLSEDSRSTHPLARRRAFRSDPVVVVEELEDLKLSVDQRVELLSELLAARIVANDPKAKPDPFSHRWLTDMRLTVVDRDGDWRDVWRMVDWCQADAFWRCNILSPSKLRKQFTQMALKASTPRAALSVVGRKQSAADLINEITGGNAA